MTDNNLQTNYLGDDEKIFEQIFKKYYPSLFLFTKRFVFQNDIVKDIIQEAFIVLYENRKKIPNEPALKSFLYETTKNKALNIIRHNKVREQYKSFVNRRIDELELDYVANATDLSAFANEENLFAAIKKAVDLLPPRCKEIFELSRFAELSNKEIAEKLGISVKTVENQMTIALRKLYESLKEYFPALLLLLSETGDCFA